MTEIVRRDITGKKLISQAEFKKKKPDKFRMEMELLDIDLEEVEDE